MYKTTIFKHHIVNNRIVVVYSMQYSMYVCGCAIKGGGACVVCLSSLRTINPCLEWHIICKL